MANKRDNSRQKRARQNRAQRAALEARTKGSGPARPSRVAPSTAEKLKQAADERPDRSAPGGSGDEKATKEAGRGKDKKRAKRERPPRRGDSPVDVDTLEGSWFNRLTMVPGGTQAMFAGVMAIVATGIVSFSSVYVSEADKEVEGAQATQTIFEAFDPGVAAALILVPLALVGAALWFSFHPQRRRIWLAAAIVLGFLAVNGTLSFYLFVAGFFAYAVFRASRVEGPNKPMAQLVIEAIKRRRGTLVDADEEEDADEDENADEHEDDPAK